ncbi:TIGR04076 family protein [Chloroflexota bacterium]
MAESYKVSIKVKSQKGTCAYKHNVGDQWVVDGKTPEGVCLSAFDALFPSLRVLMYGGAFPWEEDPDVTTAACPDAANPVVFELRRLRE